MSVRIKRILAALMALSAAAVLTNAVGLGTASANTTTTSPIVRGTNAIGPYTVQATFTVVTTTTTTTVAVPNTAHGDTPNRAPGCGYYHRWINQYDSFGAALLYTYNHQLNWCWDGVRVSSPHVYYWGKIADPTAQYDGQVSGFPVDFYYNYSGWNSRSGFASRTQGHFETDCVPHVDCFNNHYPWINLYGHYNGSLHWGDGA